LSLWRRDRVALPHLNRALSLLCDFLLFNPPFFFVIYNVLCDHLGVIVSFVPPTVAPNYNPLRISRLCCQGRFHLLFSLKSLVPRPRGLGKFLTPPSSYVLVIFPISTMPRFPCDVILSPTICLPPHERAPSRLKTRSRAGCLSSPKDHHPPPPPPFHLLNAARWSALRTTCHGRRSRN